MDTNQMIKTDSFKNTDILIVGGACVGLSLAIALKTFIPFLKVVVVDATKKGKYKNDLRSIALTTAAVYMFEQLACWKKILPDAQAIHKMIVTDSRVEDPLRPVFLSFFEDMEKQEPLAYVIESYYLYEVLSQHAFFLKIPILEEVYVEDFFIEDDFVTAILSDSLSCSAKLLVGADGIHSRMRKKSGIKTFSLSYGQMGIVCTVTHERPHHGRAEEHFLPAGPFAILPLKGNRSSLVWNEQEKDAERLLQADNLTFQRELEMRFGHHLGTLQCIGKREAFPLALILARDFIRPRFALVGDAAHVIHPIFGQGLNLGLRDAAALAEIIVGMVRLGLDPGSLIALELYQKWRRYETARMGIMADVLNRLFSNDCILLRMIRDCGLGLVDRVPRMKRYFMQQAAGVIMGSPRLLMGNPL